MTNLFLDYMNHYPGSIKGDRYTPIRGFPGGTSGEESAHQCRRRKRYEFDPWVGKTPWRRAWQPTPVFLPGETDEQRSLAEYSTWGCTKSDMTKVT